MKKLGAFLTMISLLSLVPAAFAVDGGGSAYRSGARSPVGREASNVPPCSDDRFINCGAAVRDQAVAADGGVLAYQPGERNSVGREASDVVPSQARNTPRSADETWHAGDLRLSGLYMGPDGVLHNVPKTQDPRLRIY
jgi:hypothetical protein